MKKYLVILGFVFAGCEQESEIPKDLISTEEIIPLIVDIQILEEHYHSLYARPDLYMKALDSASGYVFLKHDVSKKQFDNSISYYSQNNDTLAAIYEAAFDTVTNRIHEHSRQ